MGFRTSRAAAAALSVLTVAAATASLSIAGLAAAGPASAAPKGAISTTDNSGYAYTDGSNYTAQACLNGNGTNCNIYKEKRDVFLSGLPVQASLGAGTYFFAVLDPGSQANPNDGSAGNLSSNNDAWTNREFSVDGSGVITYSGTHAFDSTNNKLSLFPYDDTSNPGGVYILAVCAVPTPPNPGSGTGAPGANPSDCKYDAFKVGGQTPVAHALTITKDANGFDTNTFTWGIQKSVDKTLVQTDNGTTTFNYTVKVTHDAGTISGVKVTGTIDVFNPNLDSSNNPLPVTIDGVTDQLSDGTVCTVTNGGQQTLTQAHTKFPYECDLSALPQGELDNTATVAWSDQLLNNGSTLSGASADFTFKNIAFTETKINNCASVSDTLGGSLGTVCSTDPSSTTFTYPVTFTDPAGTCTTHPNTATFTTSDAKTGSSSQSVKVCVGADLTVSKDATPSFTRTYTWGIAKSVDTDQQNVPVGTPANFNYSVNVTHDNGTDSDWLVTGTITVTNPNDWESVALTGVTDSIDNGGNCTITSGDPTGSIAAGGTATLGYQCTYSSAPNPAKGTNTATATWDAAAASTPHGTASGTADADFGTAAPTTIVDGNVIVNDTLGGVLGTVSYTDPSPKTFSYSQSFPGTPGTCTSYPNTATFTTNDAKTGSSSQSVKVCVGEDLTVSKDAKPLFTRTYYWNITKKVTPNLIEQTGGGTAGASYTVTVTQTGFTDSGWQVSGNVTVTNPNDWEAVTANVTDAIDNGGTCTVTGGSNVTVPASQSVVLPYTCTYSPGPNSASFTNKATATWDSSAAATPDGSANGTKAGAFTTPSNPINQTITPMDSFQGGTATKLCNLATGTPCTLTATDTAPYTSQAYPYSRALTVPTFNCVTYQNTASIAETAQTAGASVEVCGPANTGALTMGFWQNKNGQAIITGGASTSGVCNSGTWLRQYAPFQDLSATATCTQVATYVTNIIKAANASGAAMNAMLKGQMLATALDVYFSNPSLGGNKIGAPGPIGGVAIDLTKISGSENVSSAFGGAGSLTVSQMLSYAASKSNVGGTTWYAQVKATQGLAKDAFDGINNQVAFSP